MATQKHVRFADGTKLYDGASLAPSLFCDSILSYIRNSKSAEEIFNIACNNSSLEFFIDELIHIKDRLEHMSELMDVSQMLALFGATDVTMEKVEAVPIARYGARSYPHKLTVAHLPHINLLFRQLMMAFYNNQ